MALRDLVTGGGGCSVPGGGPQSSSNANPLGALADSFFGSSKTQERIRELPALPGSAPNESLEVGPLTSYLGSEYGRDHIQHSNNQASTSSHAFNYADKARYDDAWHDSTLLQPPPTHFQTPAIPEYFPDFEQIYNERTTAFPSGPESNGTPQKILSHFLRSFLDSSKAEIPFSPTQLPVLGLSEGDKQCIRNRSSIMARHIFAGKSDEYIDTQVNALLQSLEIENDLRGWASGGPRPSDLEDYWNESQSRSYSGLRSTNGGIVGTSNNADRWVAEYGENSNISGSWAEEFEQSHGPQTWAEQFNQDQMQMGNSKSRDFSNAAALEQSRMLAQTLSQNADPKFQNSKFLQFVSKMSRGELSFEGNQVKSATPSTDWANEFQLQRDNQNNSWAAEFQSAEQSNNDGAWATEFETENQRKHGTDEQWIDEFSKLHVQDWGDEYASADSWADSYEKYVEEQLKGEHQLQSSSRYAYIFADKNPYVGQPNPLKEGQELFRKGLLSEAVLALEAEVLKNPENSEGWRLLGIAHAENDDDQQAIAAMVRARDADPINLEVLLALGVSHTNELEQAAALGYLKSWLQNNPNYGVLVPRDHPENLSHVEVVRLFNEAAQMSPGDGDIHTVLGVLYNLSREYDKAINAFQTALKIKPQDYSLWNKLGATQANSAQSADALYAYQQALDLKPNYVRAWANMGISFANQGRYEESIHYYVRALSMNPNAENAWQYLRISLSCASRNDLLEACDVRDLDKLQKEFPL